ncbi:MAG: DUF4160 domain-containing protein [Selenomonas sp.]|nr:DUF4160 domain-containing protein [Selenomonas sp.]
MPTYYRNGSLWIEIRTKEKSHPIPHVHAHFGDSSVSISLTGSILAGSLSNSKKQEEAVAWVIDNSEFLEKEWRRIHSV